MIHEYFANYVPHMSEFNFDMVSDSTEVRNRSAKHDCLATLAAIKPTDRFGSIENAVSQGSDWKLDGFCLAVDEICDK